MQVRELYKKYHVDNDYSSIGLFRELKKRFNIYKVFYPGSYVHITPSLIFQYVCYADSFRNTHKFIEDDLTLEFINKHKEYPETPKIRFFQQGYNKSFKEIKHDIDLIISLYAGFVGQAVKAYLKKGGLLVCNNSHGDASMAALDQDYKLLAVFNRKSDQKFSISDRNLEKYIIPKKMVNIDREGLRKSMRGIAYQKSPSGYIFEKCN